MSGFLPARFRLLPFAISVAALAAAVAIGAALAPPRTVPAKLPGAQALALPRPAGATYHPEHETVFVVDQHGDIGEFDLTGRRRQLASFATGRDLEGVTVDPRTGWLYVTDAGPPLIYEIDIDRDPAEVRRTFEVPMRDVLDAASRDAVAPGKGLTGICFLPPVGSERTGHFILTHGDDSLGLIEVELPLREREGIPATAAEPIRARFVNRYDLGTNDLSDVTYDATTRSLLVLSAKRRELLFVSLDGRILGFRQFPRVGMNGLALLPDRRLFVTLARGGLQWLTPEQWGDTLPSSARLAAPSADRVASRLPKPYYETQPQAVGDELFPYRRTRSDIWRWIPNGWIVFGFGAQFLFFMRFAVQWYASEKRKRVTIPVAFWYISIAGSVAILIYTVRGFRAKDSVFVAGQVLACAIYVRNLMLVYRRRREALAHRDDRRGVVADNGTLQNGLAAEVPED